ncbi:hypothetical protein HGRIS_014979 [Hohenbuehelia grisea]|uniref:Transposase n=1 Tax=Hohenbuehelia grisea TaxID=104357 RepID=A0ABR3JS09_9AGAR
MSASGCALGPDGSLLPAHKIVFYHDADSTTPLSATDSDPTQDPPPPLEPIPAQPVHPFFTGQAAPARLVAGARRSSGRVSRPSARLIDPENAESSHQARKRKQDAAEPAATSSNRRVVRKVVVDSDDEPTSRLNNLRAATTDVEQHDDASSNPAETDGPPLTDTDFNLSDGVIDVDASDTSNPEAAYATTKAMGDADRADADQRPKQERTADVRTIFRRDENRINPDTGKVESGHWCSICEQKNLAKKFCFFTGSISTLRTHIARNKDHVAEYMKRCAELGIPTNARAFSKSAEGTDTEQTQSTLDSSIVREARAPPFTTQGLLDHIVEMIVVEDEAFLLVERQTFRRTLKFCRPGLADKDIPHRNTVRAEILRRAKIAEERIKEHLKKIPGKVSFTFDAWTSDSGNPYLSVTGHYIDAPDDRPQDWELKSDQLAFSLIKGNHSGKNIGNILVRIIDRYDIHSKIGWFTSDNATSNDQAMVAVGKAIDPAGETWNHIQRRVRCMEHSVHLSASHVVAEISPTTSQALVRKARKALKKATAHGHVDLEALETAVARCDLESDGDEDEDIDADNVESDAEETEEVADALGKALALVKQIRLSPQARAYFQTSCSQVGVPPKGLLTWVHTRWASLCKFLDRLLLLKKGVNQFTQSANESDEVPDLKDKNYSDFRLTKKDWERLELIREVLLEPATATQTFSSARDPTVWRTIPVLEFLQQSWENMSHLPRFRDLASAINAGLNNLRKWYNKVDDSDAYFICLGL